MVEPLSSTKANFPDARQRPGEDEPSPPLSSPEVVKPPTAPRRRLLIVELWGLGDLVIATPFLQAASQRYDVTLLAKPYARELGARFWPAVTVHSFVAPWTAFRRKYQLWKCPWRTIFRLARHRFDLGLSARWDPRDHWLLWILRVRRRLGFPRWRSEMFLTDRLIRPEPAAHRYEHWRAMGEALGLRLPPRHALAAPRPPGREILVHSGAGQPVRVWPLERYASVASRLRGLGYVVQVACDPDQRSWWLERGETGVAAPRRVSELLELIDRAGVFLGNDSGPAHLAAFCGVPPFTLFGPQLWEWFAPMHPRGICWEGKPCPYKPCSDYCRFPAPFCLTGVREEEIWPALLRFVRANLGEPTANPPANGSPAAYQNPQAPFQTT